MFRAFRRSENKPHPLEVEAPPAPGAVIYLWSWFITLNRSRAITASGFLPLQWSEIQAWAALYQLRPRVWELDAIAMLDDLWLEIIQKKSVTFDDLKDEDDDA